MNISGIRTYAGFYDYNSIKSQEARHQQIAEAKAEMDEKESTVQATEQENVQAQRVKAEPDNGAVEYAKKYQPDATYELKGMNSDIMNLDVQKALSDMKKDQVLQQYHFFVGESQADDAIAVDREKENFYL